MTASVNLTRKRGDTRRIVFSLTSTVDGIAGPVDISLYTGFRLVVTSEKSPTDATSEVLDLPGTILDGPNGKVYFVPPGTAGVGNYYYDAEVTDDNSELYTFVEGYYKITQDRAK